MFTHDGVKRGLISNLYYKPHAYGHPRNALTVVKQYTWLFRFPWTEIADICHLKDD